jgi:putative hydrolase of the HAD superfamily
MERLSSIIRQISRGPTPEQLVSYWFRQDSRLNHKLLDDLASIRASRVKVYLATNQEHMRAKYLMEDLGLAGFVDGIYYSACLGCKKPDRAFFNQIVRSFCIKPAQLLLIDDAIQNVIAAAEAGWNTLYWNSNSDLRLVFN